MNKKAVNILLVISVILISIFGIIMIYSASYIWAEYKYNDSFKYVKNQALFFIIGLILMFFISKINYKIYLKLQNFYCLYKKSGGESPHC